MPDTTYTNDGINHLGFRIEGMDGLVTRMAEAGYEPTPASDLDGHPHRRRVYFFDANRVEWEFIEYLWADREERNAYD